MADFEQGNSFTSIGAAATTLITGRQGALKNLVVRGTGNGTLEVYNTSTTAGTAAGNLILTIPFLSVVPFTTFPLNINFSNGIVATVTGTIQSGITWS